MFLERPHSIVVTDTERYRTLSTESNRSHEHRGGPGNSDSVRSGRMASPKLPAGGGPEERGDDANTTESRSDV